MPLFNTTIAAIATPPGKGGVAVVRLSGPEAFTVADRVFRPADPRKSIAAAPGYTALFGHFWVDGRQADQTVALVFRAPKSYTGEDVAELSCHGGTAVVQVLLNACLAAGAVMAGPGEFTRRAFLNGKLSLTEAEAVMDLVEADNAQAAAAAAAAMSGALWKRVNAIGDSLLTLQSHIAAWTDYPEEDVEALGDAALSKTLNAAKTELQSLVVGYDSGEKVRRGVPTVLVGAPNVGKSTLLNLLAGREKAIVTPVPGTTRDVVEDAVTLDGVTLLLADTAGLRETDDPVEREGVRRSRERMERAALVLAVFDTARPLTEEEKQLAASLQKAAVPTLYLLNKNDLPAVWGAEELFGTEKHPADTVLSLSANAADDRKKLEQAILRLLRLEHFDPDAALLANRRQLTAARQALDAVDAALSAHTGGMDLDAVGVCVQDALTALYTLTGQDASEAVVDAVFSHFCVGK